MTTVSFHFHGYQPGDLVRSLEPDPFRPQRFEQRAAPVSLAVGSERISGTNWTDAVLQTYGRLEAVLDGLSGVASVDIEPQTLVWLLERDRDAYDRIRAAYERGSVGLVLTPPFHPILPHLHEFEREVLFEMAIDFCTPFMRRSVDRPVGLWLPEAAYSLETLQSWLTAARRATASDAALPDLARKAHFLLDARQIARGPRPSRAWVAVGGEARVAAIGRDPPLCADFAFGGSRPSDFCDTVAARGAGSLLIANDLESLLANPGQVQRLEGIIQGLRSRAIEAAAPSAPEELPADEIVEFSSWSDYDEYVHDGHTSDTRWTGFRRLDGVIVPRVHRGHPMSQLWKHAFTVATERIEAAVRRAARKILRNLGASRSRDSLRRLAIAYSRHLFRGHYAACGYSSGDLDLSSAFQDVLGDQADLQIAGRIARGYVFMLMGLRSDPRFWDNPDTRVTFQNVVCLALALLDLSEACRRAGDESAATRLLRLLRANLLEFPEGYARGDFARLPGLEGWETTEAAWHASLTSEVPALSGSDVFRRASLYAVGDLLPPGLGPQRSEKVRIVADTGHIVGEVHGQWRNPKWCEHQPA